MPDAKSFCKSRYVLHRRDGWIPVYRRHRRIPMNWEFHDCRKELPFLARLLLVRSVYLTQTVFPESIFRTDHHPLLPISESLRTRQVVQVVHFDEGALQPSFGGLFCGTSCYCEQRIRISPYYTALFVLSPTIWGRVRHCFVPPKNKARQHASTHDFRGVWMLSAWA